MTTFDITSAELNGETLQICMKNQLPANHKYENGIIDLGRIALGVKAPNLQAGEYDLVLRLKIG